MTTDEMLWAIRDDRTLSCKAKAVWLMLLSRGEECRPSVGTIAADAGVSKPTARAAIDELESAGWLKKSATTTADGDADTNSYLVVCPGRPGVVKPLDYPEPETPSVQGGGQAAFPPGSQVAFLGGKATCPEDKHLSSGGSVKETNGQSVQPPLLVAVGDPGTDKAGARPEVDRICAHLADRVERLTRQRPNITVTGWLRPARYLLDVDGLTEKQVHEAVEFAHDDEFWAPNIRSVSKLRDKLPQLRAKWTKQKQQAVPPQAGEDGWVQPVSPYRDL